MSLTEWHRYVDRHSRRVLREESEPEAEAWRPWHEQDASAEPLPATPTLQGVHVPDLAGLLGDIGQPQAAAPARELFTDLTVNDELPALRDYQVPDLAVPSFELKVTRLSEIRRGQEAPETQGAHGAQAQEGQGQEAPTEPSAPPSAQETVFRRLKASANWELLARLRGEEPTEPTEPAAPPAETTGRGRVRESREELIQRLVDPTLTLEETAMILEVCPTTVRRYTNKGLLRHFRTKGNQRRFRFNDVIEFMEARRAEIELDAEADRAAGRTGDPSP